MQKEPSAALNVLGPSGRTKGAPFPGSAGGETGGRRTDRTEEWFPFGLNTLRSLNEHVRLDGFDQLDQPLQTFDRVGAYRPRTGGGRPGPPGVEEGGRAPPGAMGGLGGWTGFGGLGGFAGDGGLKPGLGAGRLPGGGALGGEAGRTGGGGAGGGARRGAGLT